MKRLQLNPHESNSLKSHQIFVEYQLKSDQIEIKFDLGETKLKNNIKNHPHNWGLWEQDVVEVFLQKVDSHSYLEVQVAPSGEMFCLIVESPREKFYFPKKRVELNSNITDSEIEFSVKLSDIPGERLSLKGNFFAVVQNNFYATNINKEEVADFHRPDLFEELS